MVKPLLPTPLLVKPNVRWIATPKVEGIPLAILTTLMTDIVPTVVAPIPRVDLVVNWGKVTSALVVGPPTLTFGTR